MEESESFCQNHDLPFDQYCLECEQAFCKKCPRHNVYHEVMPLMCAITSETLDIYSKDINKILETVNAALYIIPHVVDDLMKTTDPDKDLVPSIEEDKGDFTTLKESENKMNNQVKDLAVVTTEYELLKLNLCKLLKTIDKVKPIVKSKYDDKLFEAYKVVMELKGFPKIINEANIKSDQLGKSIENISLRQVRKEIGQREVFKQRSD